MVNLDEIARTVKENYHKNITDDNGITKLSMVVIDAAIDASIAVLREYEQQRSTDT